LGSAPFNEPIPLRAIAVLPALDQMVFAVKQATGLTTFSDIRARKFPLRVSLRGQPDHSLHVIIDHVFATAGFSLDDVRLWAAKCATTAHAVWREPHRRGRARRDRCHLR